MKKIRMIIIVFCAFVLTQCKTKDNSMSEGLNQDSTVVLEHMEKYAGTLPCADCDGVETELKLAFADEKQGSFVLKEKYLGKTKEDSTGDEFTNIGRFVLQKDTVDTSKSYIRLVMSDINSDEDENAPTSNSIEYVRAAGNLMYEGNASAILKKIP